MRDYQARLEKLRTDAAECRLICDLATDKAKRDLFDRLATHLTALADQVEMEMLSRKPKAVSVAALALIVTDDDSDSTARTSE
jgi:hypothetical protein